VKATLDTLTAEHPIIIFRHGIARLGMNDMDVHLSMAITAWPFEKRIAFLQAYNNAWLEGDGGPSGKGFGNLLAAIRSIDEYNLVLCEQHGKDGSRFIAAFSPIGLEGMEGHTKILYSLEGKGEEIERYGLALMDENWLEGPTTANWGPVFLHKNRRRKKK
jgi:hypothetical protein